MGIDAGAIKIGGDTVHIDVPPDKADAVKKALGKGRADIHLFDETHNAFAHNESDHAAKFELGSEPLKTKDGETTVRFLVAAKDKRADLLKYLETYAGSGTPLIGPAGDRIRGYYAQAGRSIRGELISGAKQSDGKLVLTLAGSGKSFLRWSSKDLGRYLLRVDGDVIAALQAAAEIKDGTLTLSLVDGAPSAADLVKLLDGLAVSHLTVFEKEKPPEAK